MGLTHEQQMDILKQGVKEKYQGSYNELWQSADPENQQENVEVAETHQQQEQGLGGRAPQNMPDAMVFPQSQGDFNTTDMQAPIDIEKYGPQGDLVQSYKSVPPGIGNLPMGDDVGTVIERPAEYRTGGYRQKFQTEGVKDAKKGEPIMSYEELKKSLGVTELPSENYEAYLKNRSNFTGNTTISALSDKSYNKLSDPQKQVYDTFETPQGIAQTVDIGKGKLMHWENAMKMVEDTGVKNISNTPSAFSKMVSPGDFDKEVFRPHANPAMSNITIPSQQAHTNPYYDDMIAEISNLEYDPNLSKKDREAKVYKLLSQKYGYARKEYFEDLIAEVAHIPEFWRKESFINKPVSLAKDAYRFVTGQETDSARYKDPDHYEHATHGEFEENLRKKYVTKYRQEGGFFKDVKVNTRKKGGFFRAK